jgi:hypothetical protein
MIPIDLKGKVALITGVGDNVGILQKLYKPLEPPCFLQYTQGWLVLLKVLWSARPMPKVEFFLMLREV